MKRQQTASGLTQWKLPFIKHYTRFGFLRFIFFLKLDPYRLCTRCLRVLLHLLEYKCILRGPNIKRN